MRIKVLDYDEIEVDSRCKQVAIQSLYKTPLEIKEVNQGEHNVTVTDNKDVSFFYIQNTDISNSISEIIENTDTPLFYGTNNNYFYGNYFSTIHTPIQSNIENCELKKLPKEIVNTVMGNRNFKRYIIDNIDTFFERYETLEKKYIDISIKLGENIPIYNAKYLYLMLKALNTNTLYFNGDPTHTSGTYLFLGNDIMSDYFYFILPIDKKVSSAGFYCDKRLSHFESI